MPIATQSPRCAQCGREHGAAAAGQGEVEAALSGLATPCRDLVAVGPGLTAREVVSVVEDRVPGREAGVLPRLVPLMLGLSKASQIAVSASAAVTSGSVVAAILERVTGRNLTRLGSAPDNEAVSLASLVLRMI